MFFCSFQSFFSFHLHKLRFSVIRASAFVLLYFSCTHCTRGVRAAPVRCEARKSHKSAPAKARASSKAFAKSRKSARPQKYRARAKARRRSPQKHLQKVPRKGGVVKVQLPPKSCRGRKVAGRRKAPCTARRRLPRAGPGVQDQKTCTRRRRWKRTTVSAGKRRSGSADKIPVDESDLFLYLYLSKADEKKAFAAVYRGRRRGRKDGKSKRVRRKRVRRRRCTKGRM